MYTANTEIARLAARKMAAWTRLGSVMRRRRETHSDREERT